MKKIMIVIPSFEAVSPIRASYALAKGIKDEFSISFVSIDSSQGLINSIVPLIEEENFGCFYLNKNGMSNIFAAKKELEQIVNNEKPDILISYLLRADIAVGLLKTKAKKISSIRNMIEHEYKISHGNIMGGLFGFFHKQVLRKFDKLILISNDMRNYFIENSFSKDNLVMIHNFLDEPDTNVKLLEDIKFPFENELITIISISSLIKRKNLNSLIENSLSLFELGYSFNVLIIGDGDQNSFLKALVEKSKYKDKFIFTGYISNPLPYLKNSDYFVMTSLSEGVSRSLMEALYLGKICIVSNIDGNRELIENGKNGYLFNNNNEFKEILIENLNRKKSKMKNLLPYSFSYKNGITRTKKLIMGEL